VCAHSLADAACCFAACRFTHLIGYGASYYSYLYAQCLSAAIWQDTLQADPLSRSAGELLRHRLLEVRCLLSCQHWRECCSSWYLWEAGTGPVKQATSVPMILLPEPSSLPSLCCRSPGEPKRHAAWWQTCCRPLLSPPAAPLAAEFLTAGCVELRAGGIQTQQQCCDSSSCKHRHRYLQCLLNFDQPPCCCLNFVECKTHDPWKCVPAALRLSGARRFGCSRQQSHHQRFRMQAHWRAASSAGPLAQSILIRFLLPRTPVCNAALHC
jgi:hypothetical protein